MYISQGTTIPCAPVKYKYKNINIIQNKFHNILTCCQVIGSCARNTGQMKTESDIKMQQLLQIKYVNKQLSNDDV